LFFLLFALSFKMMRPVVLSACAFLYAMMGLAFLDEAQAFSSTSIMTSRRKTRCVGDASMLSAARMSSESSLTEVGASCSERRLLLSLLALLPVTPVLAADEDATISNGEQQSTLLQVTVTVSKPAAANDVPNIPTETSALYITARPNSPDNVPRAILDGSRGKPPPVLILRIPKATTFPLEVTLSSKDVTVEGSSNMKEDGSYWWQGTPLVVSARLDSDGVAATRDPTDLVGRSIVSSSSSGTVELQGRGAAGKFFTNKQPSS